MPSAFPVRRILVAIDFSPAARETFYAGIELAGRLGAEIWVLHVSEPVRTFDFGRRRMVETVAKLERVETVLNRRLDALWVEGRLRGIDRGDVRVEVREGRAVVEILAAAEEYDVELIVLAASSWDDPDVSFGSTAEKVARRADCSVLCVRPGFLDEDEDDEDGYGDDGDEDDGDGDGDEDDGDADGDDEDEEGVDAGDRRA